MHGKSAFGKWNLAGWFSSWVLGGHVFMLWKPEPSLSPEQVTFLSWFLKTNDGQKALIQIYPGLSDCPHTWFKTPASTVDAQHPPHMATLKVETQWLFANASTQMYLGKLMKLNGLGDFNPSIWVKFLTNEWESYASSLNRREKRFSKTSLEPPVRENAKDSITIWFVPFPLVGMVGAVGHYRVAVRFRWCVIGQFNPVGGWATPLKNDGVRQLGWWHSQNSIWNNITCSKPPTRYIYITITMVYGTYNILWFQSNKQQWFNRRFWWNKSPGHGSPHHAIIQGYPSEKKYLQHIPHHIPIVSPENGWFTHDGLPRKWSVYPFSLGETAIFMKWSLDPSPPSSPRCCDLGSSIDGIGRHGSAHRCAIRFSVPVGWAAKNASGLLLGTLFWGWIQCFHRWPLWSSKSTFRNVEFSTFPSIWICLKIGYPNSNGLLKSTN